MPSCILKETALNNRSETACRDAFEALTRLARSGSTIAQEAICSLVVEAGRADAAQVALQGHFSPADPAQKAAFYLLTGQFDDYDRLDKDQELLTAVYLNAGSDLRKRIRDQAKAADLGEWVLVVRARTEASEQAIQSLAQALPLFRSEGRQSAGLAVLRDLASQGNTDALEAVFHLFLEQDYPPAGELAVSAGLFPRDPVRRALYYFLTGQWEAYESVDFDHRLLGTAYEAAGRSLRSRIVTQTRRAGRTDWIQSISQGRRVRWLRDMNNQDWEAVIGQLSGDHQWESLWQLAQAAAPLWGARILGILGAQGWKPGSAGEQEGYRLLVDLAAACVQEPLSLHQDPYLESAIPGCTCLVFQPGGSLLAAALPNNEIQIIHFQEKNPVRSLPATPGQAWSLAFDPEGQFLASAGSGGDIRVWRMKDKALVKTLEGHQGLVKTIAISPDGRVLASGSFDHSIRFWRFPQGPEIRRLSGVDAEVFSLAFSRDGSLLVSGGGDREVRLWKGADGSAIRQFGGHGDTITTVAINPDGRILASGSRDLSILFWTFPEGRLLNRLNGHSSPVTHLAFHPEKGILASGSYSGEINLWSVPDGRQLQRLEPGPAALTGLAFAPDGKTLVSATREAGLFTWDLTLLLYTHFPNDQPAARDIELFHQVERSGSWTEGARKWLAFCRALATWKHRFDIEIEGPTRILAGEFDIQLG